jgi:hypothetical protein
VATRLGSIRWRQRLPRLQIALPATYSVEATVKAEVRFDFDAIRPDTAATDGYTPTGDQKRRSVHSPV